jgi:hypothetical protein
MRLGLAFVCITLGIAGCAVAPGDDTGVGEDDVVAGTLDWTHPAVGELDACSATLVARDAVVSASGCTAETFVVHGASGKVAGRYAVTSRTQLGELVLLHLAEPVPAAIASPMPIATALPADGSRVTAFGYGCASQRVVDSRKRSAPLTWQSEGQTTRHEVTCPGAPGAALLDDRGGVVAIRTGSAFALLATQSSELSAQLP